MITENQEEEGASAAAVLPAGRSMGKVVALNLIVAVATCAAVFLGHFLATLATAAWARQPILAIATAGGTLGLAVNSYMPVFIKGFADFIARPAAAAFAIITIGSLALSFEIGLLMNLPDKEEPYRASFFLDVPPHHPAQPSELLIVNIKENSSLALNVTYAQEATQQALESGGGPGVSLSKVIRSRLQTILRDATTCKGAAFARPIQLRVRGFASSSRWQGMGESESAEANRQLANLRATVVTQWISTNFSGRADVETITWASLDQMARARQVLDRDNTGAYTKERGRLNRRVEIQILDGGQCMHSMPFSPEPESESSDKIVRHNETGTYDVASNLAPDNVSRRERKPQRK